jgi:peptidoglycan/LPS O-acetylase OafA/YrhL
VIASWQGLLLLAVMFAGTVVYRWQHGQIGRAAALLSLTTVAVGVVGAHWTHLGTTAALRVWLANAGAVAVTFGLAYAIRNRPVPGVLTWLGRISYSLYLLHAVVLFLIPRVIPHLGTQPWPIRVGAGLAYLGIVVGLATLAYHMVELPGQRLGRRLTARPAPGPGPEGRFTTQRASPDTGRGENARQSV